MIRRSPAIGAALFFAVLVATTNCVAAPAAQPLRPERSSATTPAGRHACGRHNGFPLLAYNLSCADARAYIAKLPSAWTGFNADVHVGHGHPDGIAVLYPKKDTKRVVAALDRGQLDQPRPTKLNGAPAIWLAEPYGE